MDAITIFEDYAQRIPDFARHAQNIISFRQVLGDENLIVQADGTIQVKHYVGFFHKGDTRLQILPKVYSKHSPILTDEAELKDALLFIFQMLRETGFITFKPLQSDYFSTHGGDLFEILISIFIDAFNTAFRKNMYRDYVKIEDNLPFIKGKIHFSEHLRRNAVAQHLHYQTIDEFTIDNPLNIFFKGTIQALIKVSINGSNKAKLRNALTNLEDVTDVPLSIALVESVTFNRRNREFIPIYKLAKLFFQHRVSGLQSGKNQTFSFALKLNDLFEAYVGVHLQRLSSATHIYTHHRSNLGVLITDNGKAVFGIKPDFTLTAHHQRVAVLDAKYKDPFKDGKYRFLREDVYQLLGYATYLGCHHIYVIYPKFKGVACNTCQIGDYAINAFDKYLSFLPFQIELGDSESFMEISQAIQEDIVHFNSVTGERSAKLF